MSKKQGTGAVLKFSEHKRKRVDELESELDALFTLALTEFTDARNVLAKRLKKSGRADEAARVKALAKPPISAWAVNQLYWNHREEFDQLIASSERFHKAQKSGKLADMREALDARREALTHLSDLATSLLTEAGHSPSLDTIRRTTTTLEGISAYAQVSDGPSPGRLTHDVDPPGFESFASFVTKSVPPAAAGGSKGSKQKSKDPSAIPTRRDTDLTTTRKQKDVARQAEETRKAKIAAAKVSLQVAKKSLAKLRARAESLEAAQKKADAEAKKAEKHRRDVEASLEKAKAASETASRRARSVAVELEEVTTAVDEAERAVEDATQELDSLSREP